MEEFETEHLKNGCHQSLHRLYKLKQSYSEGKPLHTIINQGIRDERELFLPLNSPPETFMYL